MNKNICVKFWIDVYKIYLGFFFNLNLPLIYEQNMFLAIINDTYSEVKSDLAQQKAEMELSDRSISLLSIDVKTLSKTTANQGQQCLWEMKYHDQVG